MTPRISHKQMCWLIRLLYDLTLVVYRQCYVGDEVWNLNKRFGKCLAIMNAYCGRHNELFFSHFVLL